MWLLYVFLLFFSAFLLWPWSCFALYVRVAMLDHYLSAASLLYISDGKKRWLFVLKYFMSLLLSLLHFLLFVSIGFWIPPSVSFMVSFWLGWCSIKNLACCSRAWGRNSMPWMNILITPSDCSMDTAPRLCHSNLGLGAFARRVSRNPWPEIIMLWH